MNTITIKRRRPWVTPVLVTVTMMCTIGLLAVAGYFLLTQPNSVIENIDPQPNLSETETP